MENQKTNKQSTAQDVESTHRLESILSKETKLIVLIENKSEKPIDYHFIGEILYANERGINNGGLIRTTDNQENITYIIQKNDCKLRIMIFERF